MPDEPRLGIGLAQLYAVFAAGFGGGAGGQPDPDNPLKPGPWDPVIRVALKDVIRFGPSPEPWRAGPLPDPWIAAGLAVDILGLIARRFPAAWDVIGGLIRRGDLVSLNPQPLPPKEAFIAALGEALVARVETLAETAAAFDEGQTGGERGIIIIGGYVSRLVDDYCGNDFRFRWPFPGPPPWWFTAEVGARDLLGLGAVLHGASERALDPAVRTALGDASGKLAEAGIARLDRSIG